MYLISYVCAVTTIAAIAVLPKFYQGEFPCSSPTETITMVINGTGTMGTTHMAPSPALRKYLHM